MPDITTMPPPVGQGIVSFEQFNAMPVGTVVEPINNRGDHYTKEADGWRHGSATRLEQAEDQFSLEGYNRVVSYPDGFTPPPAPVETLRQFQWRFRDHTMHAAEQHGVGVNVVTRALTEMDMSAPEFGVGMGITSQTDRDALPEGSVLLFGDPATPRNFGMWAKHGNRWLNVLGEARSFPNNRPAIVHNIGGEEVRQDWIDEVGDEQAAREVRAWKARAWRVSAKVRDQHSWCSTFESILAPLGVDAGCLNYSVVVNGITVGDTVNPARCATLPVGTILRWHHSEHPTTRVIWFERVDGSTNAGRDPAHLRVPGRRRSAGWVRRLDERHVHPVGRHPGAVPGRGPGQRTGPRPAGHHGGHRSGHQPLHGVLGPGSGVGPSWCRAGRAPVGIHLGSDGRTPQPAGRPVRGTDVTDLPMDERPMSIGGVLAEFNLNSDLHTQIERRLLDREDAICDLLRLAGTQFGLFPEIVAEVFAEVGMGSPISDAQREMVRNQFTALMERLREEHERGHGTEQP